MLLPQGVTTATAGTGVDASKLGTVAAADGALQVTYSGKPLYWFSKDKAPGQVHGNVTDKWGKWSTVVTAKSSSGSGPEQHERRYRGNLVLVPKSATETPSCPLS